MLILVVVLVVLGLSGFFARSDDAEGTSSTSTFLDPVDPNPTGSVAHVSYKWGEGRTLAPAGEFVDVAVNELMSCAIRVDGDLVCWGQVQTELPQGKFTQVVLSIGSDPDKGSGCVLGVDGAVECWTDPASAWSSSAPDGVFVDVSAGLGRWCAASADGEVVCWGAGFDTLEVLGDSGFVSVTAGGGWSVDDPVCALDASGAAHCWGEGVGGGTPRGPWESLSTAMQGTEDGHSVCAIRESDRAKVCWGGNRAPSTDTDRRYAQLAYALGNPYGALCTLDEHGTIACQGHFSSVDEPPQGRYTKIAISAEHGCAIRTDRTIECWGSDHSSQALDLIG